MVDTRRKFRRDLAKGHLGEMLVMRDLTRLSPNGGWFVGNDRDTDIRSTTHGVIEVKTERSKSIKQHIEFRGQILPRYQWFCVNYSNRPVNIKRGPWKTFRDAKTWARKCGNPNLKGLYVKQWLNQTCDMGICYDRYFLKRLLVFFDPAALATVLDECLNETYKIFATHDAFSRNKLMALHGVHKLYHGKLNPHHRYAAAGTNECRVLMDMGVVLKKLDQRNGFVTFDFATALKWLSI